MKHHASEIENTDLLNIKLKEIGFDISLPYRMTRSAYPFTENPDNPFKDSMFLGLQFKAGFIVVAVKPMIDGDNIVGLLTLIPIVNLIDAGADIKLLDISVDSIAETLVVDYRYQNANGSSYTRNVLILQQQDWNHVHRLTICSDETNLELLDQGCSTISPNGETLLVGYQSSGHYEYDRGRVITYMSPTCGRRLGQVSKLERGRDIASNHFVDELSGVEIGEFTVAQIGHVFGKTFNLT